MTEDIPFMERKDWMQHGQPKYKIFCPVSSAERFKRCTATERRNFREALKEGDASRESMPLSALEQQYDWELHQMVGYMRRLDGSTQTIKKMPRMDPLASDGEAKHALDGSKTPYFGYWTYVAWYNVFIPALYKTFGPVVNVLDEEDMNKLLGATVKM
jgi:hypothetical protein